MLVVGAAQQRARWHGHDAGQDGAEEARVERRRIRQHEHDALLGGDAEREKGGAGSRCEVLERRVGEHPSIVADRHAVAAPLANVAPD